MLLVKGQHLRAAVLLVARRAVGAESDRLERLQGLLIMVLLQLPLVDRAIFDSYSLEKLAADPWLLPLGPLQRLFRGGLRRGPFMLG